MLKEDNKICATMIVRNEEKILSRCLDSIQGIDDIIIVDTGSTDGTIDIAKQYTDKVYTYYGCNEGGEKEAPLRSFADARNYALDKATQDWVLIIDADEMLCPDGVKALYESVKLAQEHKKVSVAAKLVPEGKVKENHFFNTRLFYRHAKDKDGETIRWEGEAHNYLTVSFDMKIGNLIIYYGRSPAHDLDPHRTLRILLKAVKSNPEKKRERYYLAREYYYKKDMEYCVHHCDEYVKRSTFPAEKAECYVLRGKALYSLNRPGDAKKSFLEAISINPDFAEPYWLIGEIDISNQEVWRRHAGGCENKKVLFTRNIEPKKDKDK